MKKLVFFVTVCAVALLTGCKKNPSAAGETNSISIELTTGNKDELVASPQTWHITNKRLLVLFGYDFNTPEIVDEYKTLLSNTFGLSDDGGLIYPVVYPGDFKHGVKGYVNDLLTVLQDDEYDFCGVVLLGAPERTHSALAKNQDKWDLSVPYPVIALFPQDEVLGIEATCDVVLDKGQTAEITGGIVPEESVGLFIEDAPEILVSTINYMLTLSGPLPNNATLQQHLSQMLKDKKIHHYQDPETGLQSVNHFVLNQFMKIVQEVHGLIGKKADIEALAAKDHARVLVISDSHGHPGVLASIVQNFGAKCDALVFCGDGACDLAQLFYNADSNKDLQKAIPPVVAFARGNGDPSTYPLDSFHSLAIPARQVLTVNGHNCMIVHGHNEGVDFGMEDLGLEMQLTSADTAFYGHTHIASEEQQNQYKFVNPGSCARPRGGQPPAFAIATFEKTFVDISFIKINTFTEGGDMFTLWNPWNNQ